MMLRFKTFDQKTETFFYVFAFTKYDMERLLNNETCQLITSGGPNFMFFGGEDTEELKNNIKSYYNCGDEIDSLLDNGIG